MFSVNDFRAIFKQFKDKAKYSDAVIKHELNIANCFLGEPSSDYCSLTKTNLFVAHLLAIRGMVESGQKTYLVSSSSIDAISISLTQPPSNNNFKYWLAVTSFGLQLLAMLEAESAGGMYIGGSPILSSFGSPFASY